MVQKKNLLIVFSGPDGSGKTTLAQQLNRHLRGQGEKPLLVHGHGYSLSQSSFGLSEKAVTRFKYLFHPLLPLALLDHWFTYVFQYWPVLKKTTLICDRYFYDKTCRLIYYQILPRFLAKIYLAFIPRPDHVFFLDADPARLKQRKKGHQLKELTQLSQIYKFLAKSLKAPLINTNVSPDKSLAKIINYLGVK